MYLQDAEAELWFRTDICSHLSFSRMLIQYGLMRCLIRQLKKYPVYVVSEDSSTLPDNLQQLIP